MLSMTPSTLSSSKYVSIARPLSNFSLPYLCCSHYNNIINFVYNFHCRRNVEKRSLLDHMEAVFLIIDELIDGG